MVVPEHEPLLYWPPGQLAFKHVAHTVLDVPEHPPLAYSPVPQVAHVSHVPADVVEWPERHDPEEHDVWDEHTVLDVPEHPPLLYLPAPQVAQPGHW